MPVYTYVCKKCGAKFDLLIGVSSEKTELKCEKCNSEKIERSLSAFSVGDAKSGSSSGSSCSTGTCPTCF